MSRQTNAGNLADLVRYLGGNPHGTKADLLDQMEGLATGASPEQIESAVERYMDGHCGGLTDADMDEVFGSGA